MTSKSIYTNYSHHERHPVAYSPFATSYYHTQVYHYSIRTSPVIITRDGAALR